MSKNPSATHTSSASFKARFWDRFASGYAGGTIGDWAGYERSLVRTRELLGPGASVLEIGCGTGSTALTLSDLDAATARCARVLKPGGWFISKTPCLREINPLIPGLAVPLMRALRLAPPVLNLREADLVAACKRQGLEVLGVERHASRGRDVRPYVVARKPAGAATGA